MYPRDLPVLAPNHATPVSMATPLMPPQYVHSGISLAQLFGILWAYRLLSLAIASAVVLLAAAACALLPRTFDATATLMVKFEVNDPLSDKEFPVGLLGSYMSTQVELARGSEVLLPAVDRLGLPANQDYTDGYDGRPEGLLTWIEANLRRRLVVEQGRFGSQLIYVTYSAGDPVEAARVANGVAEVYAEQQYQRLTGPARERAERYTQQLAELKDKVNEAQNQVIRFRKRSGPQADRSAGNQELAPAMIHALRTQLTEQNAGMAELRATLGPRHPQVRALQSQIDVNQQALNREVRAYSENAEAELTAAQYQLELETAQSVYKKALEEYDRIMFASFGGYTNVDFVSRAAPPAKASKPKVRMLMALGSIAGLGLGLVIPLIYEFFNRRVRCRDDIERDHGIPVLAVLQPIRMGRQLAQGAA